MPSHEDDEQLRASLAVAGVPKLPDAGAFDRERWRTNTWGRRRPGKSRGPWGYAAAAAFVASLTLVLPRLLPPSAPTPAATYHVTNDLDLVLGEGPALQQHTVPLRLPLSLVPLDAPPSSLRPRSMQYSATLVVSHPWAPPISAQLIALPVTRAAGPVPALPARTAFPVTGRVPGYSVILGSAAISHGGLPAGLLSHTANLDGSVLAFIGEPSTAAHPPAAGVAVALGQGLVGHFYAAPAVDGGSGHPAVPAALLTWAEGRDTYAVYSAGFINPFDSRAEQQALLTQLARTMSRNLITGVTPMTVRIRQFNDANVMWTTPQFKGVLETETVAIRAPGTPGYRTLDGLGVRIARAQRRISASRAPAWSRPTPSDPVPALAGAVPYLSDVRIPVRLPAYVPLDPGLWPRLTVNAAPDGYVVIIRQSGVNLGPNTPYAEGLGLGSWVGSVEGSLSPLRLTGIGPAVDAPTVPASQITSAWIGRYFSKGYYLGTVVLPSGIRALMGVDFAGDGNHTAVVFEEHRIYYEVGNYHSARMALKMAESMVMVRPHAGN